MLERSNRGGGCEVSLHRVSSSACCRATAERARSFVWSSTTWTKAELKDRINHFDFLKWNFSKIQNIKLIISSAITGDTKSKNLIRKVQKQVHVVGSFHPVEKDYIPVPGGG